MKNCFLASLKISTPLFFFIFLFFFFKYIFVGIVILTIGTDLVELEIVMTIGC